MNNSQNIKGNKNKVINNQTEVNMYTQTPVAQVYEASKTPFKVLDKQVKLSWLSLAAMVTFIADLTTIIMAYQGMVNDSPELLNSLFKIIYPLTLCFILASGLYLLLKTSRFLKIFHLNIANHDGALYLVRYEGRCPVCNGKFSFFQDRHSGLVIAQCMAHPEANDHRFSFTPRMFDKENYATNGQ